MFCTFKLKDHVTRGQGKLVDLAFSVSCFEVVNMMAKHDNCTME
jgi:hypothetical protein